MTAMRIIMLFSLLIIFGLCKGCVRSVETVDKLFLANQEKFNEVAQYLVNYSLDQYENTEIPNAPPSAFISTSPKDKSKYELYISSKIGVTHISISDEMLNEALDWFYSPTYIPTMGIITEHFSSIGLVNGQKQVAFLLSDGTSDEHHGILYANGMELPKVIDAPATYYEKLDDNWYYYEVDYRLWNKDFSYDRMNSIFTRKGK